MWLDGAHHASGGSILPSGFDPLGTPLVLLSGAPASSFSNAYGEREEYQAGSVFWTNDRKGVDLILMRLRQVAAD